MSQFLAGNQRIRDAIPVFDGRKNLYTARAINGLTSKVSSNSNFVDQSLIRCL